MKSAAYGEESLRSAIALGDASRQDYYRRRLQRLNRDNPEHWGLRG